jgi:flagellar protein FliL
MAAAAPTADAGAAPAKKGKKKLIIIVVAAVLVLLLAGGGAFLMLKKKAVAAEGEEGAASAGEHHGATAAGSKHDPKHPPTFVPLDPFVVNLADKDADRYAQIGITLEVDDAKFAEEMKAYMPAIRNGILMILAHKTAGEMLDRQGKEKLAAEIQRETARSMGIEVEDPEATDEVGASHAPKKATADAKDGEDEDNAPKKKKAKKKAPAPTTPNPVRRVHFANFIVQ